ncbi:TetR/AcrR family transcriptional regulator [Kaarinaea lacus]
MNVHTSKVISDQVRKQILAAASQRFTQFGYNKTTMAEIAKDCDMSAANLYRFFENKLDIGANLACSCLDEKITGAREIINQKHRPATERLQEVVTFMLHFTYNQWADNPRLNEMVNAICDARMDIVENHKQDEHGLFVELLNDGIERGEFSIDDTDDTALAISAAIAIFNIPLHMSMHSLEFFDSTANSVVRLILNGILKCP